MENQTVKEGKTYAIISHLWVIGLVVASILNHSKRNSFASFYIRQTLGINLLIILNKYIVYDLIGTFAGLIIYSIILILLIISFIGAIRGTKKVIPIIGNHFQDWFKNI